MHHAPSVSYPVGRSYILVTLATSLVFIAGLAVLTWYLTVPAPRWGQGLAALLWLTGALNVGWRVCKQTCGVLNWDGQQWTLTLDAPCGASTDVTLHGEVRPRLDAQFFMALTFRPQGGRPVWLWAQRQASPLRWLDLRRAVYDRRVL